MLELGAFAPGPNVLMPSRIVTPDTCPVCGTDVPPNARACPHCGADERSGWNEDDTRYDGLDLPDEAFADDKPPVRRASPTLWVVVAIVLLVLLAGGVMFR